MIALDFPPCQSAGVQRTLKFCEHLPGLGWDPIVLTVPYFVHDALDSNIILSPSLLKNTYRAWSLNSVKHLSFKGKYFGFTALPDRYMTWYWHGVHLGLKLIKQYQPDAIWSTFPYPSAHRIANKLVEKSHLPWLADFRDPFTGHHFKSAKANNTIASKIDKSTVKNATHLTFTTKKASELYLSVYPGLQKEKVSVIENGYNEDVFEKVMPVSQNHKTEQISNKAATPFRLVYSGSLYGVGRNPVPLFEAISILKRKGQLSSKIFSLAFRGCDHNPSLIEAIQKLNITDIVSFLPSIPYSDSIREMVDAGGLLLLQGQVFNNQIPGKVYEYLRASKPVLALSHKDGATAELLKSISHAQVVDIDDVNSIAQSLLMLFKSEVADSFDYYQYGRRTRSEQLAQILNAIVE